MFPQHVISCGSDVLWPARSPDLNAYGYFLRGYLKSNLFISKPRTIDKLKQRRKDEIAAIPEKVTRWVMGKSSRKTGAGFEEWWEASERRN
jgi:hypothetical protein